MEGMTEDEALNIVVRAGREGQKVLLQTLLQEMNSRDAEEVLNKEGYYSED